MELRAGNLSMLYDRGFLRYISLDGYEVLRMIYFALRDHNWDTMNGQPHDEIINLSERSFDISYCWISADENFPFIWDVRIEGKENSEIIFTIQGKAGKDVRKNRTGFCILHSIRENAGGPCTVISPQGDKVEGSFPLYISPHQPLINIAQMQWPLEKKGLATLSFTGDVFEMEDQRNWSDDSYKTYCTPLSIPFPALLKKDQEVFQQVKLVTEIADKTTVQHTDKISHLKPGAYLTSKPKIGIGSPSDDYRLTSEELNIIRELEFDHYRIEIDFSHDTWQQIWDHRVREAISMGLDLEVCLYFSDNYPDEARMLVEYLNHLPAEVKVDLLILHKEFKSTPAFLLDAVILILQQSSGRVSCGAGTAAYFTELNRERVKTDNLDFVSYSVNPQVHAFDDASLIENSGAQEYTVESARHYFEGSLVHVSPVTLKPRFNPNATAQETGPEQGLPDDVDVRQMTLFGGAWALASLMHLSVAGVDAVTYYEPVGWKGIVQGSQLPDHPDLFPTKEGMLFPAYHIFKSFLQNKAAKWVPFSSSLPLWIKAIGFRGDDSLKILIVNFKNEVVHCHIDIPYSQYRLFVFSNNNLTDSYFDTAFFEKNLAKSPKIPGDLKNLAIDPNVIIYIELLD